MDLLLTLGTDAPLHLGIEIALREAIIDGRLAPGESLPSTRQLAAQLGVARGTVVAAYEQLSAEGVLDSRPGARTRVAHAPPTATPPAVEPRRAEPRADFSSGEPDVTLFPQSAWRASTTAALRTIDPAALGYGDPLGERALREALVAYLGRTRGVLADAGNVLVTAGFTHGLAIVSRALRSVGHHDMAVEDPSLWIHRDVVAAAGLRQVPVRVDDRGIRVDDLPHRATSVLVTPGHHTPLGVALSASRRTALARWAAHGDRVVIEDDYDGELRYDRRPLRSMQSLDPQRMAYCGSASKALAPGLRIAWIVLPNGLVDAAVEAQTSIGGAAVSRLEQLVLAEMLRSGRYDAQVRRVRGLYRRRRDDLVAAVAERVPDVEVAGIAAGLKALLKLPVGTDEVEIVRSLGERGVAVAGLREFNVDPANLAGPALIVNFARPFAHKYRSALMLLVAALDEALAS